MRTTIDIEEDVFHAVKEIAKKRKMTICKVISEVAIIYLTQKPILSEKNGLLLFPIQPKTGIVTLELVNS